MTNISGTKPDLPTISKWLSLEGILNTPEPYVGVADDDLLVAVDIVRTFTGKDGNNAANTLRQIPEADFSASLIEIRQFQGRGNAKTKLIHPENVLAFIDAIPGYGAKITRPAFRAFFQDYIDGKKPLIDAVRANATSQPPPTKKAVKGYAADKPVRGPGINDSSASGKKHMRAEEAQDISVDGLVQGTGNISVGSQLELEQQSGMMQQCFSSSALGLMVKNLNDVRDAASSAISGVTSLRDIEGSRYAAWKAQQQEIPAIEAEKSRQMLAIEQHNMNSMLEMELKKQKQMLAIQEEFSSKRMKLKQDEVELLEREQRAKGPLQVPQTPDAVAPEPPRNIITVRGTADKYKLLKEAPTEKHEFILRESGKAVKAAYLSGGGCLMAQITECSLNVECYPDDQEELLIELINSMVIKHNVRIGPVTVKDIIKEIPSYIKGAEKTRVLNIIEARATVQMRVEARLLAKTSLGQTFEQDDLKLLKSYLPDALREITNPGAAAQRTLRDVLPPQ
jgi:hypothetical protein